MFAICGFAAQHARRARSCPPIARVPRVTHRLSPISSVLSFIAQGRSRRPELQDELEARYVSPSLGNPLHRALKTAPPIARATRARRSARRAARAAAPSGGVVTLRRFFFHRLPFESSPTRPKDQTRVGSSSSRFCAFVVIVAAAVHAAADPRLFSLPAPQAPLSPRAAPRASPR